MTTMNEILSVMPANEWVTMPQIRAALGHEHVSKTISECVATGRILRRHVADLRDRTTPLTWEYMRRAS